MKVLPFYFDNPLREKSSHFALVFIIALSLFPHYNFHYNVPKLRKIFMEEIK